MAEGSEAKDAIEVADPSTGDVNQEMAEPDISLESIHALMLALAS